MISSVRRRASALAVFFLMAAPAAAQAPSAVLRPGDALRIEVWRQPELSGEFTIAEDGGILHPLYRQLSVTGLDLDQIEDSLRVVLARYETNPAFVIQPLLRVSIGGAVGQPSLYRLPPTTTIAEAIARAGGIIENGNAEEVDLFRSGGAAEVDLTTPDTGLAGQPIRSGDQIFVPRRASIFRDYVVPAASVVGAAVAIISLLLQ